MICRSSDALINAPCLRFLFRFADLLVRMWLWYAFFRLTLPLLSIVKRFAAPRHDLSFGIGNLPDPNVRTPHALGHMLVNRYL